MWKTIFLLLLSNFLLVQSIDMIKSKDCKFTRKNFAAPAFASTDNLSSERCGLWDKQKSEKVPWRVAIVGGGADPKAKSSCYGGLLISPTTVITWVCGVEAITFNRAANKTSWKAFLGKCVEEKDNPGNCEVGGKGQQLQIEGVKTLSLQTTFSVHLWKIQKANLSENAVWPICLFNKNNQNDFKPGQNYQTFHTNANLSNTVAADFVEDMQVCLKPDIYKDRCDRLERSICVHSNITATNPMLVNKDADRFFLRGILDFHGKDVHHNVYVDLIPFLQDIVSKSTEIAQLSKI